MKLAVIIKPYDSKLPKYFEMEKSFLIENLGEKFKINHVGSSAISGLGGKNFVDIQLLAPTKKIANKTVKKLESIGYTHVKDAGDKYRIFFNINRSYNRKKIHVHLHLMWKTSNKYKDYLLFRDYLRKHSEEIKRYYSLKKKWAKKAGSVRKKFTEMKTDYVKEVLKKAKKEV